jgi:hypothetical protein
MSPSQLLVVAACAAVLVPAAPADAAPRGRPSAEACAAARHGAADPRPPAGQALSPETAAVLAQARSAKSGSAAPNAEAQAALNVLANLTASRGDADSLAAAEAVRAAAGRPGAAGGDAMNTALAKLGC